MADLPPRAGARPRRAGDRKESRPTAHQRGYTYAWQKARAEFLKQFPLCRDCLEKDRTTIATDVHHTKRAKAHPTLFWDRSLWKGLCGDCHKARTARGE